jgi:hypothetical protein
LKSYDQLMLLIGTTKELVDLDAGVTLATGDVTGLAGSGHRIVALLDHQRVLRVDPAGAGDNEMLGELDAPDGQSIAVLDGGEPVVGRRGARLARFVAGRLAPLTGFDAVPGRADWQNPAGPTPDTRSLAATPGGQLWVNVHVGGVWSTVDGGLTWRGVIDPPADVHEIAADAEASPAVLAVAAAIGFGWSRDGGRTWSWTTDGLHASYSRAAAVDGETALVTASTGPFTRQAAVYRATLGERFERCQHGLPEWFASNVDTGCVDLDGDRAAIGTSDGEVYTSVDRGVTWELAASDLDPVQVVELR